MSLASKIQKRAQALKQARTFFIDRSIHEVDCSVITSSGSIDEHIDLFTVHSPIHGKRYLVSSPEYQMKRMLASGSGDIFFLGHVFRDEHAGMHHTPEFLMAEWYRIGFTFDQMIEETFQFCELFTGKREKLFFTYQEAFQHYLNIDPFNASLKDLHSVCPQNIPLNCTRDDLLNLLVSLHIQPAFPKEALTVLTHYPASQAALARHTTLNNHAVAERFEVFCHGLELANGFHELNDPKEQKKRFSADNAKREKQGKQPYPIDEQFTQSLSTLPDCSGVAVGVDRLIMLKEQAKHMDEIYPLSWTSV